ncbi:MAG TPA: hypothetical protein VD948_03860, partial [Rhodothermales bacterium]|nr:hypothetical protein [Rhodothermales bacterium]
VGPDEGAERLRAYLVAAPTRTEAVRRVLADGALWDADLTAVPGFAEAVTVALTCLDTDGPDGLLASP